MGDEKDYYSGEIKEHILAVLHDSLSTIEQQTRRYDIIRDIINNNGFEGKCIEKAEELKRLLRGYKGMTSAIRQDMEAMGIVINEDGKHYKLTLSSDSRYTVTIAKTPSDHRAGLNCANIIAKKMF